MADCKFPCSGGNTPKENICIETNRILDSCRDRDCYENVRVLLTRFGNDIIEHTSTVRTKCAEIAWASIGLNTIQFNKGFYSVNIRLYVKLIFEACVGNGHSQEFDGIAVIDKTVILFGGENASKVFRSKCGGGFCSTPEPVNCAHNLPEAVLEVVEPVILGTRIIEEKECSCCCSCCSCCDIPECVCCQMSSDLCDEAQRYLAVSIGIFSVVRLVRPGQFVISASEFNIPNKECIEPTVSDPCSVFRKMPFPTADFGIHNVPPCNAHEDKSSEKRCGC